MFTFTMICVCVRESFMCLSSSFVSVKMLKFSTLRIFLLVNREHIPDQLELFDFVIIQILEYFGEPLIFFPSIFIIKLFWKCLN